jgi:hypothetical protein
MRDLLHTASDPEKSFWLDYGRQAAASRFPGPDLPNGISPEGMQHLPFFMTSLDPALRDENLNPVQPLDFTNKMMDAMQKLYLASNASGPQPQTASDAGGLPASGRDAAPWPAAEQIDRPWGGGMAEIAKTDLTEISLACPI